MDKLTVYNTALRMLGESALASLSENREPLRHLNAVWDGGAVDYLLSQGLWNFAMRSVKLLPDEGVASSFGYKYAYSKPADYVRMNRFCQDENFASPLLSYTEEGGMWLTDSPVIYLQYVSNDTSYGADFSLWTPTFVKYAAAYLASEVCEPLTQSEAKVKKILSLMNFYRTDARSKDTAEQAPSVLPNNGSFVRARRGSGKFGGNNNGGVY